LSKTAAAFLIRPIVMLGVLAVSSVVALPVTMAADGPSSGSTAKAKLSTTSYVDTLIEEAWKTAGIKPAQPAKDEEFLRRAYLDLLGRIPNIKEARAFLQTKDADRREKLVIYLLDHPDFAKNLATQWTVLMVGRGNPGQMVDRDALNSWLRKQFTAERPWNEMVKELVSSTGSNKENGAVNFVLAHLEFDAVPLTSLTTRLFMGQQIQCTQCHDHPQNDWKQNDFWGINAFFKGMKTERVTKADSTGLEAYDHTELTDEPTDAYVTFDRRKGLVGVAFPRFLDGKKISQGRDVIRRTELGKLIADPNNEMLAKAFVNRLWAHFLGRGFVNPVDDFGAHNPPSHPELLEKLAAEFKASGYNIKKLCRTIMASRAYQLSSVSNAKPRSTAKSADKSADKDEGLFSQMQLKPMSPEQLFDSLLTATMAHKSGGADDSTRKRDAWMRQFIFAFGNDEAEEGSSFQGTIPQALMMMNGELMQEALSGKSMSFLGSLIEQAQTSHAPGPFMVESIYMAALSRRPTVKERDQTLELLENSPDSLRVLQDLFWALLNSNEFILIH
jgi:hypothetical protein